MKRKSSPNGLVLITGGAGFIGTNLADRLLNDGRNIRILDNLSRSGVDRNLQWLVQKYGPRRLDVIAGDIRDPATVEKSLEDVEQVHHLAAQVAVTTSLDRPLEDFDINARGTLNLLEAIRKRKHPPSLVFTSTNKVYGNLTDFALRRNGTRYEPVDAGVRKRGIGEGRCIEFCSPYGCSKGAADQYVLDYARVYRLPAVVFRMSCIYGPHQQGTEDQGWVAHFLIRSLQERPITVYGDGLQVRDVLFVDDLSDALLLAQEHVDRIAGNAFNIGGGPENTLSLVELLNRIEDLQGKRPDVRFSDWRQSDQLYFVADSGRFRSATGWSPRVDVSSGIAMLHRWLQKQALAPSTEKMRELRARTIKEKEMQSKGCCS